MQITRVSISNFRCIQSLVFEAGETTVIIGENNAGKSSVIDAIKIVLGRRWGRSGTTGFSEFDFRKVPTDHGLRYADIEIVLEFGERSRGEWLPDIISALNDVIITDTTSGLNSIKMRVRCSFVTLTKAVEPEWQFLNEDGQPFSGRGGRNQNLSEFFNYVPAFSMDARRDASSAFAARSQFWGGLLKSINISEDRTQELEAGFAKLNSELLNSDPKIEGIKQTLKDISKVIAKGAAGDVDLRAIPANLWEIISKTELVVQGADTDPWLPITRHGQGVQSLAVIFLFRAFVENAIAGFAHEGATPILTLEEPEAHLHPQASRALWEAVSGLPGQKIVTTHSPHFVQNIPITEVVVLKRDGASPQACRIPRSFSTQIEVNPQLLQAVSKHSNKLSLQQKTSTLVCRGTLSEDEYRELLVCYTAPDREHQHAKLKMLKAATQHFLTDDDLSNLENWAKRIRGEIFFAKKWLLCEGPSDFTTLCAIADRLGYPLDVNGVAVIDYQNNGAPGAFASLARTLGFPWVMLCDADGGGDDHIAQLKARNFSEEDLTRRVVQLPNNLDLEGFLAASSLRRALLAAVHEIDVNVADSDPQLHAFAKAHKVPVAFRLARSVRSCVGPVPIPDELVTLFTKLREAQA